MLNTHDFYRDPEVIKRILEYCGVPAIATKNFKVKDGSLNNQLKDISKHITVEYLSGWGEHFQRTKGKKASSLTPEHLGVLLESDLNIFRSVWDKQKITFVMDIEYLSHKFPGEAYVNPVDTFWKMEPVYRCFWDTLQEYNITPMTLVTGQGYHFVFDVNSYNVSHKNPNKEVTATAKQLVELGHVEETLKGKYEHFPESTKAQRKLELDLGKTFDSVGKLLEFITHKVMQKLPSYGLQIPVGVGDLIPGNDRQEMINLDLSTYVSPLFTRVMRTAFSIHDKHKYKNIDILTQITIPRFTPCNGNELSLDEVFHNRRNFRNSAEYAKAITMNIPTAGHGVLKLIKDYKNSDLYKFHQDFDNTRQDHPNDWHKTYDRLNLNEVPPCIATSLANPNPALLQPAQIQTLVRALTGKQWWHPKHVAGLIRSKYERNHDWEYNWGKYDANKHAKGWVRMYAGFLAMGLDQRTDQNCISHQEKGLCTQSFCGYNLGDFR